MSPLSNVRGPHSSNMTSMVSPYKKIDKIEMSDKERA